MIKLTAQDLGVIFSMAKDNVVDLAYGDLNKNEHAAKCWIIAINARLHLNLEIDFPEQRKPVSLKDK